MKQVLILLRELLDEFQVIKGFILAHQRSQLELLQDGWIDGPAVMKSLRISNRTLQTLRDSRMLPYSRINGKFYYRIEDLKELLNANYSPSKSSNHAGK